MAVLRAQKAQGARAPNGLSDTVSDKLLLERPVPLGRIIAQPILATIMAATDNRAVDAGEVTSITP